MPVVRRIRVYDDQHHATLMIDAPRELADRIAYEFLRLVEHGKPPQGWRETWPEIKVIEEIGRQE